jgi:hypothetical protein
MKSRILFCAVSAFLLLGFAPSAAAQARSVAPSSGKGLCSALTPEDFTKAGVAVTALDKANLDGTEGAYCLFRSKTGKVEFDVFFPAGATPAEVQSTEKTVLGEGGDKYEHIQLAGADSAWLALSVSGQPNPSAAIVVRRGKAVLALLLPSSSQARQQLTSLAQTALGRLKQ